MSNKINGYKIVIGRAEEVALVGLVENVPAKVDTGAYNSAIHYSSIKEVKRDGIRILKAKLLGHPCSEKIIETEFTKYALTTVTNSFGKTEERYEVDLRVKLGPKVFTTPFTLANRENNLFPVLVGRKSLKGRFLVDVSKTGIDRLALKNGRVTLDEIE